MAGFLHGRLLEVGFLHGRLLGVGPLGAGSLESAISYLSWGRFLRLGHLLGVGPGDSRPGEGGPMLCMLEGLNGLIIFQRARGSRLGYPWPFTPTVVPEAGWASRLRGGREARSASYLDEPAARSRLRLGAPCLAQISKVGRRESVGACAGPRAGRSPPANHVAFLG